MDTLIAYEGVHGLGRKNPRALLADTIAWLHTFAAGAEPVLTSFKLDLRNDMDPPLLEAYEDLAREYGPSPKKIRGIDVQGGPEYRAFLWPIASAAIEPALARAQALESRGGVFKGRAGLKLVWKFRFRDPDTGALLPGQDALPVLEDFPGGHGNSSSIVLNLGWPSSASLWFLLPFADVDDALTAYVQRLQAGFPVVFNPRGWRRWKQSKSGNWHARKISVASR